MYAGVCVVCAGVCVHMCGVCTYMYIHCFYTSHLLLSLTAVSQVYDWTTVHRAEVTEAMRSAEADIVSAKRAEEEEKRRQAEAQGEELPEEDTKEREAGFLPRETFLQCLTSVGIPCAEDKLVKLAALHDKTKSGNINYAEFLSEQKYITAVSPGRLLSVQVVTSHGCLIEITWGLSQ